MNTYFFKLLERNISVAVHKENQYSPVWFRIMEGAAPTLVNEMWKNGTDIAINFVKSVCNGLEC